MDQAIRITAADPGPGGDCTFIIEVGSTVITELRSTEVTLGALYASHKIVDTVVRKVFGDGRDDLHMDPSDPGKLRVSLRCFTDERFLEVFEDYKSGNLKQRLFEEFSNNGFKIKPDLEGFAVKIENIKEVEEKVAAINKRKIRPQIIVLGGAYSQRSLSEGSYIDDVKKTAKIGYEVLRRGGTAVDAVEAAVSVLEESEDFNAGYGSVLSEDGEVECDAMIMDGNTLNCGAVTSGRHFRNPVSLAKLVMEKLFHCALSGEGALKFAEDEGFPVIYDMNQLITERAKAEQISYEEFVKNVNCRMRGKLIRETKRDENSEIPSDDDREDSDDIGSFGSDSSVDTVSAVARDANGYFACAVSTGGMAGKKKGRVSDASMVGCGGYANKYGAATTSGPGESIIKMTLAREVVYMMESGRNAQDSVKKSLKRMKKELHDKGGVIAIDQDGNFGRACTTKKMIWASIKEGTLEFGTKRNQVEEEQL